MSMTDADVFIVGAGPTGLMLASELRLAGIRTLVVERRRAVSDAAKAGGINGHILEVVRHRELGARLDAAAVAPRPGTGFPWGGIHVPFTALEVPPMEALPLPQPDMERLMEAYVVELGGEVRRGYEVVGLEQDDEAVHLQVVGPDGAERWEASYVVGCDGRRSSVRELLGVAFPGRSYPETERMATVSRPAAITVLEDGSLDVAGHGPVPFGYTATEHGVFACAAHGPDLVGFYTSEDDPGAPDDDVPLTVEEMQASIRRVLGVDIPMGEPRRLTRFTYHARQAERYRVGRAFLAGDAAHLFPAGGVALNAGMVDAVDLGWKLAAAVQGWAPDDLLDTYESERRLVAERTLLHTRAQVALRRGHDEEADALRTVLQELLSDGAAQRRLGELMAATDLRYPEPAADDQPLVGRVVPDLALRVDGVATTVSERMRAARPVLFDLADRPDLRAAADGWSDRVEVCTAATADRPADAVLVRPDTQVAWVAGIDEPEGTAVAGLRQALGRWCGSPGPT